MPWNFSSLFARHSGASRNPAPSPSGLLVIAKLPLALRASGLLLALLRASCPPPLRGQLRCSRRSCGAVPKSRQKARRLTRCPARHARRGVPALLAFAGSLRRHSLGNCSLRCSTSGIHAVACAASRSRRSLAATLRADPAKAAMLGTANGAGTNESVHPCTTSW
jgi:hypothetical protein